MGAYQRRFRRAFFIKSSIFQRNRRFFDWGSNDLEFSYFNFFCLNVVASVSEIFVSSIAIVASSISSEILIERLIRPQSSRCEVSNFCGCSIQ